MGGPQWRERIALGIAAGALVAGMFVVHFVGQARDITSWIRVGTNAAVEREVPPGISLEQGAGYDGKYFYRLARDPLGMSTTVDGISLDRPAFRQQRIGYPALAWGIAGGGRAAIVPWSLVIANGLALVGSAMALGELAARRGNTRWLGLAGVALPASVMAFHFNLAEAVEACFLLWTLVLLERRRWTYSSVMLLAALLTRETSLVLVGAIGLASLIGFLRSQRGRLRPPGSPPWYVAALPFAAYLMWTFWISSRWAEVGQSTQQTVDHLSPNILAIPHMLGKLPGRPAFDVIAIVLFLLIGLLGLVSLPGSRSPLHERLALLAATAVALTFDGWDRAIVYLRHPGIWAMFAVVLCLSSSANQPEPRRAVLAVALTLTLAAVVTLEVATTVFPSAPAG